MTKIKILVLVIFLIISKINNAQTLESIINDNSLNYYEKLKLIEANKETVFDNASDAIKKRFYRNTSKGRQY